MKVQLLFFIINVLVICPLPANTEYHGTFSSKDKRLLNDGNVMPAIAYGTSTYTVNELGKVTPAVISAIEAGFRHLDTAAFYVNEELVGQAIKNVTKRGIVKREEIFICTKLIINANTGKKVVPALKQALKRLQLSYVDLFLIHSPYNPLEFKSYDLLDIWKGMEDAKDLGLTKSIGVSNFELDHLSSILRYCKTKPAVNQLEVNPTYTNEKLVDYCQRQGIIVTAYGPMGFTVPRPDVTSPPPPSLKDPVLVNIAKKYRVTPSQVVLRFAIDSGVLPISRSTNIEHIRLNVDILKFSLTDKEVETIKQFNKNRKVYVNANADIREDYYVRMDYARRQNRKLYAL